MLTESHEKKVAWTRLWYLTQRDAEGGYKFFKNLSDAERNIFIEDYSDFLDYERSIEVGARLGEKDNSDSNRIPENHPKAEPDDGGLLLDMHDPNYYSFGEDKKWIPWAFDAKSGTKRGRYSKGYPTGLVLHWTAGHRNGLQAGNELMRNTGMLYLLGDKDGKLAQSDSLIYHGYHSGKSSHKYANGYVSDEYCGLELQAAGYLKEVGGQFKTWWGGTVPRKEVVYSGHRANIVGGNYHVYTWKQMLLARKLCCWLYLNNPNVFSIDRVVGHDEVSPRRKVDPGASVVGKRGEILSMPEFRKILWNDVDKIKEQAKKAGK